MHVRTYLTNVNCDVFDGREQMILQRVFWVFTVFYTELLIMKQVVNEWIIPVTSEKSFANAIDCI